MGALIKYELKKILENRAGMVACVVVLLFLSCVPLGQYVFGERYDQATETEILGLATVEYAKDKMNSHAGALTDDVVETGVAAYEQAQERLSTTNPEGPDYLPDDTVREAWGVIGDHYYPWLTFWLVMDETGGYSSYNLEENAKATLRMSLDEYSFGNYRVTRTQPEKDYWTNMASQVSWPLRYGYEGAWDNALMNSLLLGLGVIAVCVALSGVFSGEYQARTASIVLPTKRGRCVLPIAKAIASFIFVTVYWLLISVATIGIHVAVCGTDGWDLPFQIAMDTVSPYPLTMSEVVLHIYLLGYVIALGMGALTLLLSSKLRSSMPVAVIPIALVLLGLLAQFMGVAVRVTALTPISTLTNSFRWMLSYDIGGFVADLPTMTALVYGVLIVVCVPVGICAFARHQVR